VCCHIGHFHLKFRKPKLNPNQLPLFTPDSEWVAPEVWPDLSQAKYIGLDCETHDPLLHEQGPGFIRKDAIVCGISLATELGDKLYLPIGHVEGNVDKVKALAYVKAQVSRPHQKIVGANLAYDLEALWSLGIEVKGRPHDIQVAEPLLDADKDSYSLEALAKQYLGKGKTEALLREAEVCYGVESKKGMYLLPAKFVGPYAEDDADDALQIFLLQEEELRADNVTDIYALEAALMPVLLKMRLHGVRVDLDKAEQLAKSIRQGEQKLYAELCQEAGCPFEVTANSLAPVLLSRGIRLPRTAPTEKFPNGNPSLTNEWLLAQVDPLCKGIVKLRKMTKMRCDFIEGSILRHNVKGRLHTRWVQLRGYDDEEDHSVGVKPGRIASQRPNLTQIPKRDKYWGPLIRSLFIPDEGGFWTHCDYSQQEPRIALHFACTVRLKGEPLPGAFKARQRYLDDPDLDYHQLVRELILEKSGKDIGRDPAKTINLGVMYVMGLPKLARKLGISPEVAREILTYYHMGVPYIKPLTQLCTDRVEERGYIRTILGRKQRFPLWEPSDFQKKYRCEPLRSRVEALALWGEAINRANSHVAINPLVQGSAADQTKSAIIQLDVAGLLPQIQVYDELNLTCHDMGQVRQVQLILENAVPQFTVPFKAEPDTGSSWGELKAWRWIGEKYAEA
jgi:DNA polymerase I-like protein with 3'-5' exonuclease and polymerase domains